jgi:hypothetical protein
MWGHPSLLLRDIAVNESDQQRVSDSGAIRSGLVPQLKHNAIHRRSPAWRTLLECTPALAEALQPPVSGECAILSPSSEDVTASMQDQRFLVLVGARRRMSRDAPTGAQRSALRLVIGHAPSVATLSCYLATIASVRTAIICAPAIYCLELQPRCYSTRSRWWSRPSGRRSPVATRTMASKWAFAGLGGSGYLMPSEMHARLKALLERMAIDLNARLDPVSAIL